jgi:hypothetical protein
LCGPSARRATERRLSRNVIKTLSLISRKQGSHISHEGGIGKLGPHALFGLSSENCHARLIQILLETSNYARCVKALEGHSGMRQVDQKRGKLGGRQLFIREGPDIGLS